MPEQAKPDYIACKKCGLQHLEEQRVEPAQEGGKSTCPDLSCASEEFETVKQ